jgi:regulatory protein
MDAALYLLKARGRTERDMAERLLKKRFMPEAIGPTIARLKELNLLNDDALARTWAESGRRQGWGEQRLKQALWKRGVPRDIIVAVLAETPEEGAPDESARARESLARRVKRMKLDGIEKPVIYRRLGGYLARQGFSPEVVRETLENFFKTGSPDSR